MLNLMRVRKYKNSVICSKDLHKLRSGISSGRDQVNRIAFSNL